MSRSICEILVFKTFFENDEFFFDRFKKIMEMFEDYIINSWINLDKIEDEDDFFKKTTYYNKDLDIKVIFKQKKDINKNYFPVFIVEYFLNEFKFEKENIVRFLNDNIKFIYNVFKDEFFVDYDEKFKIDDINKWKKINFEQLKKFDLENKKSHDNKLILDSMMYLYYTNIKNLAKILNIKNIFKLNNENDIFWKTLELSSLRIWEKEKILLKQTNKLKQQIDVFLDIIS